MLANLLSGKKKKSLSFAKNIYNSESVPIKKDVNLLMGCTNSEKTNNLTPNTKPKNVECF